MCVSLCGLWMDPHDKDTMARLRLSDRTVSKYREALTLAHNRYDSDAKPVIQQMNKYFSGEQWRKVTGDTGGVDFRKLVVNLIFSDIKVILPVLALRNPRVFVKPTGATVQIPVAGPNGQPTMMAAQIVNGKPVRVVDAARAQEALINWRWRQLRINRSVRRALVDSLLAPFGLVKVGYTFATEKVDLESREGELLEPNEIIKTDSPFAVRWSPQDFRVDPEARYPDLSDAGWIAFGWLARPEDVKKNPRFSNTRDIRPTVELKEDGRDTLGPGTMGRLGSMEKAEERMRIQLWEIWDKRSHRRIVLAEDHEKALEWVDWPQAYENFPVETLYFTEYPDTLYGKPDLWHVIGQQDAYNEIASMILNHVKRFLRKYITRRGALDEKEMAKLISPVDGVIVEADVDDPSKAVGPVPDANIPTDWWQTRVNFREDHDRVSGIADFIRGVAEKVDTATEASFIQSNLNVRTNDTRSVVEDFAERISRQLLRIDMQTLDLPRAIPVIGPDGAMVLGEFINVMDRETLMAQSDVEIEVGSMQPVNQFTRKKDILEVYTLLRNDPLVDQFELRRRLGPAYRDSIPDIEKLFLSRQQVGQIIAQAQLSGQGGQPQPGGPRPRPATPMRRPGVNPNAPPTPPRVAPPETTGEQR